jgi:acetaldehyde dehydrogenase (acetylating)
MKNKFRILEVGAGMAGAELLHKLMTANFIELVCVCDVIDDSTGIKLAKENGVPTCQDALSVLKDDPEIDIIIDVTGVKKVRDSLRQFMQDTGNQHTVIMHESIAALVVSLFKGELVTMKEEDKVY